jgi:hypothetical protein
MGVDGRSFTSFRMTTLSEVILSKAKNLADHLPSGQKGTDITCSGGTHESLA